MTTIFFSPGAHSSREQKHRVVILIFIWRTRTTNLAFVKKKNDATMRSHDTSVASYEKNIVQWTNWKRFNNPARNFRTLWAKLSNLPFFLMRSHYTQRDMLEAICHLKTTFWPVVRDLEVFGSRLRSDRLFVRIWNFQTSWRKWSPE